MAPIGTLWGKRQQPQTKIVLSVAALNGLELKQPEWDPSNEPAVLTSSYPYGKIPIFEGPGSDGFKLIEVATIARYLSRLGTKVNLLGSNPKEAALVDQWIHFAEEEIGGPTHHITGMIFGQARPFNRKALDMHTEYLAGALAYVESHLATCRSGYLVSNAITLADFFLAAVVFSCSRVALGAAERAEFPRIYAHYAKVTGDNKVKHLWGTELFTKVAITERRAPPCA